MRTVQDHRTPLVALPRQDRSDSSKTKKQKKRLPYKKISGKNRATYIEERAKETAKLGKIQEERKIHTLLTTKKTKVRSSRQRFLRPKLKGAGVSQLTVE